MSNIIDYAQGLKTYSFDKVFFKDLDVLALTEVAYLPFEQIVYVGDNLNKDFQAPRQLGMREIYYKNEDGLYSEKNDCAENTIYALIDLVTYIGNREKRYEK